MSVLFQLENGVARITIDRPERMNAIDAETEAALGDIWTGIEADDSIRCVVLTGSGERAFSAGADLKSDNEKTGLEYWASTSENGFGGIATRQSLTIPVIARVNGLALGGGMEMVLGCDIVIATQDARFGMPEAKVGRLPLSGGMIMLQRLIPEKIAAGMMMTGRMMSSQDALSYGLVNAVVPRSDLDAEVDKWVADIISCAPLSLKAIKQSVRQTSHLPLLEAKSLVLPETMAALNSEDANEGVAAFREKRQPDWQGR